MHGGKGCGSHPPKSECSRPCLPASRDLRSGVDSRQDQSQPYVPQQPVEGSSELRVMTPGEQTAMSPEQRIEFFMSSHAGRMRRGTCIVRIASRSVDERQEEGRCGFLCPENATPIDQRAAKSTATDSPVMRFQGVIVLRSSQVSLQSPGPPDSTQAGLWQALPPFAAAASALCLRPPRSRQAP